LERLAGDGGAWSRLRSLVATPVIFLICRLEQPNGFLVFNFIASNHLLFNLRNLGLTRLDSVQGEQPEEEVCLNLARLARIYLLEELFEVSLLLVVLKPAINFTVAAQRCF